MTAKRTLAEATDAPPAERSYWVLPSSFLAGAYPSTTAVAGRRQRVAALWDAGIRTFVSLVEEHEKAAGTPFVSYADVLDELSASRNEPNAKCIRFGIRDGDIPSVAGMRSVLDTIDLSLDAGRPLYLHCYGGMGRTATVVGCWLLRHGLASHDDVFDTITRLRRADVARRDRKAPEDDQRDFVRAWSRDQ
jgi:hypothetical protein